MGFKTEKARLDERDKVGTHELETIFSPFVEIVVNPFIKNRGLGRKRGERSLWKLFLTIHFFHRSAERFMIIGEQTEVGVFPILFLAFWREMRENIDQ